MNPLEARVQYLEGIIATLVKSDRYTIERILQLLDGRNIILGTSTGTKIGTAATQKLAFYGTTPIVRPTAPASPSAAGATYSQSTAQSNVDATNSIITALQNLGLFT